MNKVTNLSRVIDIVIGNELHVLASKPSTKLIITNPQTIKMARSGDVSISECIAKSFQYIPSVQLLRYLPSALRNVGIDIEGVVYHLERTLADFVVENRTSIDQFTANSKLIDAATESLRDDFRPAVYKDGDSEGVLERQSSLSDIIDRILKIEDVGHANALAILAACAIAEVSIKDLRNKKLY